MKKEYNLGKIAIIGADLKHKAYGNTLMDKMDYNTVIRLIGNMQDV